MDKVPEVDKCPDTTICTHLLGLDPPSSVTNQCSRQGAGWTQFGDKCSQFTTYARPADKARSICKSRRGHLTSSTSEDENMFMKIMAQSDYYYLGGTQIFLNETSTGLKERAGYGHNGQFLSLMERPMRIV